MKLTFASRIFAGYFVVVGIAAWFLVNTLVDEIKPVVRQTVEYTLVDTANVLAELLADSVSEGDVDEKIVTAFARAKARQLNAKVWIFAKDSLTFNIYVTNANGIVIFDSEHKRVGEDYSQWRDVYLTLKGRYGARSTWQDPEDPFSSVMHVAAPIKHKDKTVGVVTVFTPNVSIQPFLDTSRNSALQKGILLLVVSLVVGGFISYWLSHAVTQLVKYAKKVSEGERVMVPKLGGSELQHLAHALDRMRTELEGKHYVESYVQQLTHELKSPVSAIRGAAELLGDKLPEDVRHKFANNVLQQSERINVIIEKMLYLSSLEKMQVLDKQGQVDLAEVCRQAADNKQARAEAKQVNLVLEADASLKSICGDEALLQLAIDNLIENAIDFAPSDSTVKIMLREEERGLIVTVFNAGEPVPEYAITKVFDRFYSLPRPDGTPKSTGLGLSLVNEVAQLHQGSVTLTNIEQGVKAELIIAYSNQ